MSQPELDTDYQKRHGLTYARLAAGAAGVPRNVFDTEQVRQNQRQTIRVLTDENSRLLKEIAAVKAENHRALLANEELTGQVRCLQERLGHVQASPDAQTPAIGPGEALDP